jgi:hypothetical protein
MASGGRRNPLRLQLQANPHAYARAAPQLRYTCKGLQLPFL